MKWFTDLMGLLLEMVIDLLFQIPLWTFLKSSFQPSSNKPLTGLPPRDGQDEFVTVSMK
jgi:hypothetical protein